jgi:hypothetical protein
MKYRKKPVVIDAIQYLGDNKKEVFEFTKLDNDIIKDVTMAWSNTNELSLTIFTLEGKMRADIGDWIIKGVIGEFYPCKPDIFEKTYEKVNDEEK